MLADIMTKGISKISFEKFKNKLGVIDIDWRSKKRSN
jgi:hypothetical protein